MRESENIGKLVSNLVQTDLKEHILFPAYGITTIDSNSPITRGAVQSQVSIWYPGTVVERCTVDKATPDGHFELSVQVSSR